jgi:hypothetical protein
MTDKRPHKIQTESLQDRLSAFARDAEQKAEKLPPGAERDELLKKAQRSKTASDIDAWASSK